MAKGKSSLADEVRIVHDKDGWHFNVAERDDEKEAWLATCQGCGRSIVVSEFHPTAEPETLTPAQSQTPPPQPSPQEGQSSGLSSAKKGRRQPKQLPPP